MRKQFFKHWQRGIYNIFVKNGSAFKTNFLQKYQILPIFYFF